MDPQQWLDNFEAKLAVLQQKSTDLQDNLAAATVTVSSPDGSVTIVVGVGGALQNIQLGHRACDLGPARLTKTIMETARTAQRNASRHIVDTFEPLGEGTTAMEMIKEIGLEDPAEQEEIEDRFAPIEADPAPAPRPAPPMRHTEPRTPPPPPRRTQQTIEDEDELRPW